MRATVIINFTHTDPEATRRYTPPDALKTEKKVVSGNPDINLVSTSYIEKQNHTVRMHCRRLSRLTNAFSKKGENFDDAIALDYAYYNFCNHQCYHWQELNPRNRQPPILLR